MRLFLDFLRITSRLVSWLFGAAFCLCAIGITADIAIRKLIGVSLFSGAFSEISTYVLAISVPWCAALTLFERGHVRIDTILILVPQHLRSSLDVLAIIVFSSMFGFLGILAVSVLKKTIDLGSVSMTPLAIPQAIPQAFWVAGWIFLFVVSITISIAAARAAIKGNFKQLNRLAGSRSIQEDIDELELENHPRQSTEQTQ